MSTTQIATTAGEVVKALDESMEMHECLMSEHSHDYGRWYELPWWKRLFTPQPKAPWSLDEENDYDRMVTLWEATMGLDQSTVVMLDVDDAALIGLGDKAKEGNDGDS